MEKDCSALFVRLRFKQSQRLKKKFSYILWSWANVWLQLLSRFPTFFFFFGPHLVSERHQPKASSQNANDASGFCSYLINWPWDNLSSQPAITDFHFILFYCKSIATLPCIFCAAWSHILLPVYLCLVHSECSINDFQMKKGIIVFMVQNVLFLTDSLGLFAVCVKVDKRG